MDYVTFKIVTNPNFRVVIISKTETMAKKFLVGIKRRLTNPAFSKLQIDFAPANGFENSATAWTSKMIYFGHGDSDQKDPNVEVLGIGQQIYGARADLIILDDVEDLSNAPQYAAHLDYIMQDVMTRDAPLLVVGTRVAPIDIYSELMNPEHYDGESSDRPTSPSRPSSNPRMTRRTGRRCGREATSPTRSTPASRTRTGFGRNGMASDWRDCAGS